MQQSETFVLRLLTEIEGESKVSSIMLRSVRSGEQQVFQSLAELVRHLESRELSQALPKSPGLDSPRS
ncbi:MAG: hypothetical protein IAF08_03475 [Rhizobacter sp.]|nr:hypothetical protein [Chlorobiales bacterium]